MRYCLVSVLAVAVCATLAGARSYTAIAEWACDAPLGLRAGLGLPGAVPDLVTIWRVLTAVDRWPSTGHRLAGLGPPGAIPAASGTGGASCRRQDRARRPDR